MRKNCRMNISYGRRLRMSNAVEKFRKDCVVSDTERDAGLKTPEDVERFDDIQYGPDEKWNVLDVYLPKERGKTGERPEGRGLSKEEGWSEKGSLSGKEEGGLPVIVSVHGGGWVYGDKELYQFYCMSLAQRGFAVVNFTYRLAPEHKYPAQMEDVNRVMEWIFRNGAQYGFDLGKVFLVGDSAGAHLAGLYACICTNPVYASGYPFAVPEGFVPKALALNCGVYVPVPTGVVPALVHEQVNDLPGELMPGGCTEEEAELIDVTKYITSAFPPAFIMTATEDFCRPQAVYLEKVLKEIGVPHVYKIYGEEDQPLQHVFHVDMRNETGRTCNDEECAFFRDFCGMEE